MATINEEVLLKPIRTQVDRIMIITLGALLFISIGIGWFYDALPMALLISIPAFVVPLLIWRVAAGSFLLRLEWVRRGFKFCLAVVLRPKETKRFVLVPRRWVVGRTFAWLNLSRRLRKSYERLLKTDESWIYVAMPRIMLNRLA